MLQSICLKILISILVIESAYCFDFDKKLKSYNKTKGGPGVAIGILHKGKVLFEGGYGYRDSKNKINPETSFRLASVSKQFTAMAIAILEDQKKINANDSIRKYFPEFPKSYQNIKVRHLIHHMSGLPDYMSLCSRDKVKNPDVVKLLKKKKKLNFNPGEKYEYSNSGYVVLASLVERVSGMAFPEFMKKNVFLPLKMKRTLVFEEKKKISKRAYGVGSYPFFKKKDFSACNFIHGDGGVYSSLRDLYRWRQVYRRPKLVSKKMLKKILSKSKTNDGKAVNYSYGILPKDSYKKREMIYHGGSWVGFKTMISYFPKEDLLFVILSNYQDFKTWTTFQEIADEVFASI